MLGNQSAAAATIASIDSFAQSAWASARRFGRLDSEMAAGLRIHLFEAFDTAKNWVDLKENLQGRGFYLQRSGEHLWLRDNYSHVEICTCGFLGFSSAELDIRFGSGIQ